MRVLILSEFFPRGDGDITGGAEAVAFYMSRHLGRQHEVEVIHSSGSSADWSDASLASLPRRLKFLITSVNKGRRKRPSVVIGTSFVDYGAAWMIGLLTRARVVFWYHDVLIGRWTKGGFGKAEGVIGEVVERILLKLPRVHYVAISEKTALQLEAQGVSRSHIDVIHCGVEPELIGSASIAADKSRDICVVGRLVPYKRVDVVISAFAAIASEFPNTNLKVVGQGPEMARLQGLARDLGIDSRISFMGLVPTHVEVLREIASSAALVSASEVEGFGIILVEAMSLGVPQVVSDIPAFREVTADGVTALIAPAGDTAAFSNAISKVLGDPGLAHELRTNGIERSQRFEWPTLAEQASVMLERLVSAE